MTEAFEGRIFGDDRWVYYVTGSFGGIVTGYKSCYLLTDEKYPFLMGIKKILAKTEFCNV